MTVPASHPFRRSVPPLTQGEGPLAGRRHQRNQCHQRHQRNQCNQCNQRNQCIFA